MEYRKYGISAGDVKCSCHFLLLSNGSTVFCQALTAFAAGYGNSGVVVLEKF